MQKIGKLLGDQKDLILEDKGEHFVNQIEHHGNNINNEVNSNGSTRSSCSHF